MVFVYEQVFSGDLDDKIRAHLKDHDSCCPGGFVEDFALVEDVDERLGEIFILKEVLYLGR